MGDLESNLEMNSKMKEDALKQLKKHQTAVKELQRDAEEAHAGKAEVITQYKDLEKKVKNLEADMIQLQEDLSAAERARRTAEAERDDLQEEINSSAGKGSIMSDEKRRLDARIAALEEELEEEQGNSEMLMERAKKAQINIEQLTTELAQERGQCQKLENNRMLLERQNKELKTKLNEVETAQRAKAKATIAALESKIANLEEQLQGETAERMAQAKINRKAEKKMKENLLMLEDERRHADQYKEQSEKVNSRIKALKRQLDETEEEVSREKAARRKTQRELEDLIAENESKEREITNLKNKLRGSIAGSGNRRRVDRDRDFLGSLSQSRRGASVSSEMDFSQSTIGNSTANSSNLSPLTMSTEDLSISGKINANAQTASSMKEENPESSYHEQEHKQT